MARNARGAIAAEAWGSHAYECAANSLPVGWSPLADDVYLELHQWSDSDIDLTEALDPITDGLQRAGVFVDEDQIAGTSCRFYSHPDASRTRSSGLAAIDASYVVGPSGDGVARPMDEKPPAGLTSDDDVVVVRLRSAEDEERKRRWARARETRQALLQARSESRNTKDEGQTPSTRIVAAADPARLFPLPAGALLGVVGLSYYPDAVDGLREDRCATLALLALNSDIAEDVEARNPAGVHRWFNAQLLSEPNNPHDANAIAVVSPHGQIGHISASAAVQYAEIFVCLRELGYAGAACPGFLDAEVGSAALILSWPSVCWPPVNEERRKQAWQAWHDGVDLQTTAGRYGFNSVSSFLAGARQHARECGFAAMPPTASELRSRR